MQFLKELIIEKIDKKGKITFHRMFGKLIAKQLEEMWRIMGKGAFTVVEMGANRGWLCYDIVIRFFLI